MVSSKRGWVLTQRNSSRLTRTELHIAVTRGQSELSRREARIVELHDALRDVLAMLEACSFGGHKTYRCLTAFERARLEEIRRLMEP